METLDPASADRRRRRTTRAILGAGVVATVLGGSVVYVATAGADEVDIPGALQAEDYTAHSGARTERTSDTGGGTNVGWLADGDWLEYRNVTITSSTPTARIAALNTDGGSIEARLGSPSGALLATFPVAPTGGWQRWTTVTAQAATVPAGPQTLVLVMRSTSRSDFVNINYLGLGPALSSPSPTPSARPSSAGPSPTTSKPATSAPVTSAPATSKPATPKPTTPAPTGTGSSSPAPTATTSRPPVALTLGNTFERPPAGQPYGPGAWAADGWKVVNQVGMETRTRIDGQGAHNGGQSVRVFYPKGQIDPVNSGLHARFDIAPRREYYISQWVKFSKDFSFGTTSSGGKLGVSLGGGAGCSGGNTCDGTNGFTVRPIWKSFGTAAIYYYSMDKAGQYGDYQELKVNGSTVTWPRDTWVNVVARVRVNTVTNGAANPDGELEVFYNGTSAARVNGIRFVKNGDQVDRVYFSSFHGGATSAFAPANDSSIWYDDLKVSADRAAICELDAGGCR